MWKRAGLCQSLNSLSRRERAVVVAQLVERSLPTPEIKSQRWQSLTYQLLNNRKDKNKKEAGNGPSLKKLITPSNVRFSSWKSQISILISLLRNLVSVSDRL